MAPTAQTFITHPHHISGVALVHTEQFNSNQPVLSQIWTQPQTFINASGNHLAAVVWDKKKRRRRAAFHRIFFPDHSRRNPITAVFGDQWDYRVSKRKEKTIRAYLISSFSRRRVLVMRFLVSPASLCFPLSSYLHLSHLSSPIFHFPILPSWLFNLTLRSVLFCFSSYLQLSSLQFSSPPVSLPVQCPVLPPPNRLHHRCGSPLRSAVPPIPYWSPLGLLQRAWRWCTYTEWETEPNLEHFSVVFLPSVMKISRGTQWVAMTFQQHCISASVAHSVVKCPGIQVNQTPHHHCYLIPPWPSGCIHRWCNSAMTACRTVDQTKEKLKKRGKSRERSRAKRDDGGKK